MKELSRETWVFPTTLIDINLSQLGAAGWHLSSHSWHESPPLCILQQPWESGRQHWPAIDAEASPHIWKYSGVVWGENFAEKEPCPQGVTKFIEGKQSRNIWATVEGISYVKSKGWWRHTKAAFLGQLGTLGLWYTEELGEFSICVFVQGFCGIQRPSRDFNRSL